MALVADPTMAADTARVRWRRAMTLAIAPREADDAAATDDEIEYEMELEERMGSSHATSRFPLLRSGLGLWLLGLGLGRSASSGETLLKGFLIHPDNR